MTVADSLIRDAVQGRRLLPVERTTVIGRMATAPFVPDAHTAAEWSRIGTDVVGEPHPSSPGVAISSSTLLTSCEAHVAKRVKDGRWQAGTTPFDYLDDLHAGAGHPEARLQVGRRRPKDLGRSEGRLVSATFTLLAAPGLLTKRVVRLPGHTLFVVYDAERSCISTGYSEPDSVVHTLVRTWDNQRMVPRGQ